MESYSQHHKKTTKAWCFTLNNYEPDACSRISDSLGLLVSYFIIGKEVGEQGTPHLQGYAFFNKRTSFTAAKRAIHPSAHLEPARGKPDDNRRYCSKEGDFIEFGEIPLGPGVAGGRASSSTRSTIAAEFVRSIQSGRDELDTFAAKEPGTWYFSGHNLLRNYLTLLRPESRPDIKVDWVCGDPGVGKSRWAHETLPNAYIKEPRTKWWNGYIGEKEVIIDDFGPGGIDINHLLRWFDRYKCHVENKGGMVALLADRFIITSNFSPSQVYYNHICNCDHAQMPALLRRINVINM